MLNLIVDEWNNNEEPKERGMSNFWLFWIAVAMSLIGVSAVLYGINTEMAVRELIHLGI